MVCEICGRNVETKQAIVEGAMLDVCENCSKFGNVVEIKKPVKENQEKRKIIKDEIEEDVEILIDGYPDVIKKARERRELTQEKLARALAEKESTIQGVESGKIPLSFKLARKLEQFFGIKLIDSIKQSHKKVNLNFKSEDLTIGDLIKLKKDL
jgi:putative transcription factor